MPELRLSARIAADGLSVVVDVAPGDPSGLPEISAALRAAGVVFVGRDAGCAYETSAMLLGSTSYRLLRYVLMCSEYTAITPGKPTIFHAALSRLPP